MSQLRLELEPEFVRPALPKIYVFENLNINQKINYRSAPCNLYGSMSHNITEGCYRDLNVYGLDRGFLDYSTKPHNDYRKP